MNSRGEVPPDVLRSPGEPALRHALREQEALWGAFLEMAGAVVLAVEKGVEALCDGRIELVPEVGDAEERSDRDEHRIEAECLRILALYEPVASDLRRLATILKVSRDCERIADRAARIARRGGKLARKWGDAPAPDALGPMARDVLARVRDAYAALVDRDAHRARAVIEGDRSIDRQYRRVRKAIKAQIGQDPQRLGAWLEYLGAARNLERIADHAADIAQMTVFLEEGRFLRDPTEPPRP